MMQNRLRRVLFVARLRVVTRTANYCCYMSLRCNRLRLLAGLSFSAVAAAKASVSMLLKKATDGIPREPYPRNGRVLAGPKALGTKSPMLRLPGQRQVLWGSKRRPFVRTSAMHHT